MKRLTSATLSIWDQNPAIWPINVRRRHLSEVRGSSSMHKQSSNMHNMCSTSHASTVTCYCTYYKLHDITITLLPLHTPDFVSSRPRQDIWRRTISLTCNRALIVNRLPVETSTLWSLV